MGIGVPQEGESPDRTPLNVCVSRGLVPPPTLSAIVVALAALDHLKVEGANGRQRRADLHLDGFGVHLHAVVAAQGC